MVVFGRVYHERVSLGVQTRLRSRGCCRHRRFANAQALCAKDRAARTKQRAVSAVRGVRRRENRAAAHSALADRLEGDLFNQMSDLYDGRLSWLLRQR